MLHKTISEPVRMPLSRLEWRLRRAHATHCKRIVCLQLFAERWLSHFFFCRATNDSFFRTENTFLQPLPRTMRTENAPAGPSQLPVRPLSSTDESGPVQKRLRPTTRQRSIEMVKSKSSKVIVDEPLKKARARPALTFANIFSSPGRRSQPVQNSKTTVGTGKNERTLGNAVLGPRRSTRLLSGASNKPSGKVGHYAWDPRG